MQTRTQSTLLRQKKTEFAQTNPKPALCNMPLTVTSQLSLCDQCVFILTNYLLNSKHLCSLILSSMPSQSIISVHHPEIQEPKAETYGERGNHCVGLQSPMLDPFGGIRCVKGGQSLNHFSHCLLLNTDMLIFQGFCSPVSSAVMQ